jgi:hypothetical protein
LLLLFISIYRNYQHEYVGQGITKGFTLVAPLDEIQWLSAPFGKTTIAWAVLNFNSNRPMLEGFLEMVMV